MGNLQGKTEDEFPDPRTGLTPSECRLIKQTWKAFSAEDQDYMDIFLSFFRKSPESMQLFPHFRGKALGLLPNQPQFRAHAWAVGYQLAALVECSDDSTLLEALIRKNARRHARRHGVRPDHFDVMGSAVIEAITSKSGKAMTPAAVAAWEKLTSCIGKITASVYEEEQVGSPPQDSEDTTTAVSPAGSDSGAKAAVATTGSSSGATEEGTVVSGRATSAQALGVAPKPDKPSPTKVPSNERNRPAAFSGVATPAGGP